MKIKSNLVNLLAGAALGSIAVLSIAAASTETFSYGRFQLIAVDHSVFKIDTSIRTPEAAATNSTPNIEKNENK
jgi:hypothetical protein